MKVRFITEVLDLLLFSFGEARGEVL